MVVDTTFVASTVASVMMNGVCCLWQMQEEEDRRDAIRRDIRVEYERQKQCERDEWRRFYATMSSGGMEDHDHRSDVSSSLSSTVRVGPPSSSSSSSSAVSPEARRRKLLAEKLNLSSNARRRYNNAATMNHHQGVVRDDHTAYETCEIETVLMVPAQKSSRPYSDAGVVYPPVPRPSAMLPPPAPTKFPNRRVRSSSPHVPRRSHHHHNSNSCSSSSRRSRSSQHHDRRSVSPLRMYNPRIVQNDDECDFYKPSLKAPSLIDMDDNDDDDDDDDETMVDVPLQ